MAILIALGIALVTVAFVAAPFFFNRERPDRPSARSEQTAVDLQDLLVEKETVYAAIQELDFDFKSGKLSDKDHAGLRQRHEERAANLLKAIDELQAATKKPEAPRRRRERRRG